MRRTILYLASLLVVLCVSGGAAHPSALESRGVGAESCGAGKDLVVQALEHLQADSGQDQLSDASRLLKTATETCSELGEAWYYRSLVEQKLGHATSANFALEKAKMFPSEAMAENLNPFVLSTPPPQTAPLGKVQGKWALIVGISKFADKNIPGLNYTTDDARSFRDMIANPKYGGFQSDHIHMLTDEQATMRNIRVELNWLARSAAPDDLALVYVATHGSARDMDTGGVSYIITHDTEIGPKDDPDTLYATALPMVELSNAVATRFRARRAAIFIDTCYSGEAAGGPKMLAPGIPTAGVSKASLEHISQGSGRIIFAASTGDETSMESDQLRHGYFTYYLVDAVHQLGGNAPLSAVYSYVRQHVSDRVAADFKAYHEHQTPVMSRSSDNTDFALLAGETPKAPAAGLP